MRRFAVASLILSSLVVAGCPRSQPSAGAPERPLVIGQITSAVTLDPHLHDEQSTYSTLSNFYDALVGFGPELDLIPSLALRWENPSDVVWRIFLRKDVLFHDGRPFGAADVVASIQRARTIQGSRVVSYLQSIDQVRAVDDSTVEITTRDPAPVLLNKLAFIGIVPRDTGAEPIAHPVGTGPYRFVSGAPGSSIRGERFDRHWGGVPAFRSVVVVALPEARDRVAAVASGRADIVTSFPEESLPGSGTAAEFHIVRRAGTGISLLGFPMGTGSPFTDRRVRQAAALAIDRARLARTAPGGVLVPANQIVPAEVFGYSSDLGPIPYDVQAARRLMSAAGHEHGFDVDCIFPTSGAGMALDLVDQLAAIGMRLHATALPWDEFYKRRLQPSSQVAIFSWFAGTGDASNILDAVMHSARDGYGAANTFSYSNPELDRLIELSDRTSTSPQRRAALALAMKLIREDMPFVPLVQRMNLYAVRNGFNFVPRADRLVRAMDVTR